MKKINEFFGYALYIIGVARMLLIILVLIKMISNLAIIFNGGYADLNYYNLFSTILAYSQLILAIGSIVMIILNVKKQPGVIRGYLWGLGAVLIELITPRILIFYVSVAECGIYMKAGNMIRNVNSSYETKEKTSKKMIKNTDWFYTGKSEQDDKNKKIEMKNQKKIAKLEEEIDAWKRLLDSGEIDKTTYNEETNRLIEKQRRISQKTKII